MRAGSSDSRVGQLFYRLNNGAIDNWLVAGPHVTPLPDGQPQGTPGTDPVFTQAPVERDRLEIGETALTWRAYRCLDDHFVDLSAFYPNRTNLLCPTDGEQVRSNRTNLLCPTDGEQVRSIWQYAQVWAYTQVVCPADQHATFMLTTNGPADVWLNGQRILQHERFHHQHHRTIPIPVSLQAGHNQIWARLDTVAKGVAKGESPWRFALVVAEAAVRASHDAPNPRGAQPSVDSWSVRLPTRIAPLARRQELERLFEDAYLDRDVYTAQDGLEVYWPDRIGPSSDDAPSPSDMELRLQTLEGRIYMMARAATPYGNGSTTVDMGTALRAPEGACHLVLRPGPEEFSLGGMRVQRTLRLHVSKNPYAEAASGADKSGGAYSARRLEALIDATRRSGTLFCEIAKMAIERWSQVKVDVIQRTIADLTQGAADSACSLVGLLGMLARYGNNPSFPAELRGRSQGRHLRQQPLADYVVNFPYWLDEPRQSNEPAMFDRWGAGSSERELGGWGESRQILYFAGQILAGQLYPGRTFANSGRSGQWHRAEGESGAIAWLQRRGRHGFEEWDSNTMIEAKVVALLHLVDLAENDEVRELAAVVLDTLFFGMALNSYRGAFGSTQGRGDGLSIRSARFAPSSGLSRLLWGMGVFNEHIMGSVSLACSDVYILPPIIEAIAADLPEAMWNRERHSGAAVANGDEAGSWEVNKVTYRTPDYMLCSAQDYLPGQPGSQEHIWQATFGPDAVIFVNHPACLSEADAHRPNCWRGNAILPRVAQWRDVLIAAHTLPEDDWLGFTHAYFPIYAFDEYKLQGAWAFARKGAGYLALTAAQGLTLTRRGEQAYRELRSYGRTNIWLCHLGRTAEDGSFADFQRKILDLEVDFARLSAHCTTLRGESLAFGWTGPLRVNGHEEAITDFKRYENPYCVADAGSSHIELRFGEDGLRLHYE